MFVITQIINGELAYQNVKLDLADAEEEFKRLVDQYNDVPLFKGQVWQTATGTAKAKFSTDSDTVYLYLMKHHITL